eukprot:2398959-Rhodomonas_salina.1
MALLSMFLSNAYDAAALHTPVHANATTHMSNSDVHTRAHPSTCTRTHTPHAIQLDASLKTERWGDRGEGTKEAKRWGRKGGGKEPRPSISAPV